MTWNDKARWFIYESSVLENVLIVKRPDLAVADFQPQATQEQIRELIIAIFLAPAIEVKD
jgi:hypothetical protein